MTTTASLLERIGKRRQEILDGLLPEQAAEFDQQFQQLLDDLSEMQQSMHEKTDAFVQTHPVAVDALMRAEAASSRTSANRRGSALSNTEPVPGVAKAANPAPKHAPAADGSRATDAVPKKGTADPTDTKPQRQRSRDGRPWTAEQYLQLGKEAVTALLALVLLFYTVEMARSSLNFVGDQQKMSDAKDVLLLIFSLVGVALGYYFGRVPADARAAQAQQQVATAAAIAEEASAKAEEVANHAEDLMTATSTSAPARRGMETSEPTSDMTDSLQRLREDVRALRRLTRYQL